VVASLAFLVLIMLAMVHAERRRAQWFAVITFATAAALSIFVILIYDQPFARGGFIVRPTALIEIRPP
jgi:hypothetical protein